jgi:hypothetical protein
LVDPFHRFRQFRRGKCKHGIVWRRHERPKIKNGKDNNLIKDDDTIALITGKDRKMKALHSFKKLGGTRIRPDMKLICLFGSGA